MSIFEALAYRVAFGMGPQGISKLKALFPNQVTKFEAVYGSIEKPTLWKKKLETKNPVLRSEEVVAA